MKGFASGRRLSRFLYPMVMVPVVSGSCRAPDTSEMVFGDEEWAVEGPALRIGSLDDPRYAFRSVVDLALSPVGILHSLHRGEATILRWDRHGEPAGVIGGKGEGPGEFDTPGSLGFFGDTLWVMDRRAYRVSYFDLDGNFLGSVTPRVDISQDPDNPYAALPRPALPLRDGNFYGIAPAWSDAIARGRLSEVRHVLMDPEGENLGTVWVQPYRPTDVLALLRETGGTYGRQPFGDRPLFHVSSDGVLLVLDRRVFQGGERATIDLTKIGTTGDTILAREIEYTPVPLPREKIDSAVHARAESMFEFVQRMDAEQSLANLESELREATYSPDYQPAVRTMVVAENGSIWLQCFDPSEDGIVWWVLDQEAQPVATASTPEGLRILLITGDSVWGVETDDLDVSYIVRYDLVRR